MEHDRYGGAMKMATPEQARRMREIQEVRDLLARKEIQRKEKMRRTRRVPTELQTPTLREELNSRR